MLLSVRLKSLYCKSSLSKPSLLTLGFTLLIVLIVSGCTSQKSQWKAQIGQKLDRAQTAVENLQNSLNQGNIRNALLLKTYADVLKKQNPDMNSVVDLLVQDANWDGPMVKAIKGRLSIASSEATNVIDKGETSVNNLLTELDAIADASSPVIYGLMLTDPINVIADMSNGTLGRVESMSKQASMSANGEKDYGKGSQLVGNPSYGSWQQNSSGQSFWAWYGMYSLFSRFSSGPVYYGNWASNRGYSYYSDHGRDYYTSPEQKRNQSAVQSTAEKKFKQQGKTFKSPYANKRTGGATTASVTKRAASSSRRSSRQQTNFKPSNSSSQRSSSYKTSRSFRGGK